MVRRSALLATVVALARPRRVRGGTHRCVRTLLGLVVFAVLMVPARAGAQAAPETVVVHGSMHTETFGDDICGPRANTVVFTLRTEVAHVTWRPDGSLSFTFIETGTYNVDFDDPALADQTSQFTGASHFTVTPGATLVYSETWHDFPTGLRIWFRVNTVEVDGRLVVDREVTKVTGCP